MEYVLEEIELIDRALVLAQERVSRPDIVLIDDDGSEIRRYSFSDAVDDNLFTLLNDRKTMLQSMVDKYTTE